jgi:hypothetical protein
MTIYNIDKLKGQSEIDYPKLILTSILLIGSLSLSIV